MKVGAFGLERWLDLEAGAYGSDPHERRSDLVAVARERAAARYGEPTGAVLVGDTPLDVLAAREAGRARGGRGHRLRGPRRAQGL